jgi:hypothetical protein
LLATITSLGVLFIVVSKDPGHVLIVEELVNSPIPNPPYAAW